MKILIVEDDAGLSRGISFALAQDGYKTLSAGSRKEALEVFQKERPDAVLLDLNLPDGDGIELCQKLRKESEVPILMLTARDMELDEIMGFDSGADDYITKPFSISVLKIRLKNALKNKYRGEKKEEKNQELCSGSIRLDLKGLRVYQEEKELDLSMTEFRLLQYFLENKNQVLLKEQILLHIWDEDGNFVEENTLSVNISRLRRKIGGTCIKTIHGMGYLWEEQGM